MWTGSTLNIEALLLILKSCHPTNPLIVRWSWSLSCILLAQIRAASVYSLRWVGIFQSPRGRTLFSVPQNRAHRSPSQVLPEPSWVTDSPQEQRQSLLAFTDREAGQGRRNIVQVFLGVPLPSWLETGRGAGKTRAGGPQHGKQPGHLRPCCPLLSKSWGLPTGPVFSEYWFPGVQWVGPYIYWARFRCQLLISSPGFLLLKESRCVQVK